MQRSFTGENSAGKDSEGTLDNTQQPDGGAFVKIVDGIVAD